MIEFLDLSAIDIKGIAYVSGLIILNVVGAHFGR